MKQHPFAILGLAAMSIASCAKPEPSMPTWVSEKVRLLEQLGIDPRADLREAANYHWTWISRRGLAVGTFRCPIGSSVDVSRSIVVVYAPSPQGCRGSEGDVAQTLKVLPDGSAEPLGAPTDQVADQVLSGRECPNLKSDDALGAARAAFARGDCHLLMMGGFAGVVPGDLDSHLPSRMIAGTGDDGDTTGLREQCAVPRPAAARWAEQYNRTIVALNRARGGCGRSAPASQSG